MMVPPEFIGMRWPGVSWCETLISGDNRGGPIVERLPTYEQLYASFRWNIPARYNIAADVCDRHAADPSKIGLIGEGVDGKNWRMTFREIQRKANQLANLFVSIGLIKGDRVMLLLGQNPWTAIAHVACWKAGLVSVPVSTLFAADAIAYRLHHVGVRAALTDLANLEKLAQARKLAPETEHKSLTAANPQLTLCSLPSERHAILSQTSTPRRTIPPS